MSIFVFVSKSKILPPILQVNMALYSRYGNVGLRETLWAKIQDYVDMMWAAF